MMQQDVRAPDGREDVHVLHRARHKDLASSRLRHHPCAGMDGDPGDCVIDALALTGVEAGANLETKINFG